MAATHFGRVQLGDVHRRRRVCTLVAGWVRQPGASLPQLGAGTTYASKAAYCLLSQPGQVGRPPDHCRWVVADRAADVYEHPLAC